MNLPKPVGYYCDHSDEPHDARTHHDWEFVEYEGWVFQHKPDTISSHAGTQEYLTPEQQKQRCPRAVPVYPAPVVETLQNELARIETEIQAAIDRSRDHERDLGISEPAMDVRRLGLLAALRIVQGDRFGAPGTHVEPLHDSPQARDSHVA